ncbi:hypothetical protein [Sphingobacterium tabacisoli]|uniref:Lipoprotein n=1 Tax=Sphingobacterium tabacisoli TaxID=2044855 RepID=A0ABW5L6C1_9SPHI|nr:hypothetical protein [Sphingobacterium tabacisoli]
MKKYLKSGIAAFILIALASCLQSQPTDSQDHVVAIDSTAFPISAQQQGAYFLLTSSEDKLSLNKYQEDKIVSLGQYDININSIYTSDGQSRVAVLDTTSNRVRLYDIELASDTTLRIPYHLNPKCILINGDYLFVGGGLVDEMLIGYHLESKKWFKLDIPDHMRYRGKEIDDLILNGDQLIAIDNIILPKYVLFYILEEGAQVSLIDTKLLKSNGPYESIKKGRLSAKYFGLMSDTESGYTGLHSHITIYKGIGMKEAFSVSTSGRDRLGYLEINDFVIVGNTAWIAYKGKGLGKLPINDSWFVKDEEEGEMVSDIAIVDISNVQFEQFADQEIEHITQIPNTQKIVLTLNKNGVNKRQYLIKE